MSSDQWRLISQWHCGHAETQVSAIEAAFQEYTERKDIAILLINQHVCATSNLVVYNLLDAVRQVAEKIRPTVDRYQQAFPSLLEIPSKDHPYGELDLADIML